MCDDLPSDPITIDEVLTFPEETMAEVHSVGDDIYWIATCRAQGRRRTVKSMKNGQTIDLTPNRDISSAVNEYGGGAFDVDSTWLVFTDSLTSTVYAKRHGGQEYPITIGDPLFRYGGFRLATDQGIVLAVREDHHGDGEPRTEIVTLSLHTTNDDGGKTLCTGADFYSRPAYYRGRIAWCQWDHPNMPWDDSQIWLITDDSPARQVAGGTGVSALNPIFLDDGQLAWFDDSAGFWNVNVEGRLRFLDDHDHCPAPWTLIEPPLVQISPTTLVGVRYIDGVGELVTFDLDSGQITSHDLGTSDVASLSGSSGKCFTILSWPTRPNTLCRFDQNGLSELIPSTERYVVRPESIWFEGPAGSTHAWLYPAANSTGPAPTLVVCHGGPTGMAYSNHNLVTQFWCSRGIQVLSVNYSGSSGFGRRYRQRLHGEWGVLDIDDITTALETLVEEGRADPKRIAVAGTSAGGYTVFRALTTSRVFTAGISAYGIADLEALVCDTHKFEARYLDGLIGEYPKERQTYLERSPINHVAQLSAPMLILQGREDRVVPVGQAEMMADAVRAKGLEVELIIFDGEGHGFRNPENQRTALEAQLAFLARTWSLETGTAG